VAAQYFSCCFVWWRWWWQQWSQIGVLVVVVTSALVVGARQICTCTDTHAITPTNGRLRGPDGCCPIVDPCPAPGPNQAPAITHMPTHPHSTLCMLPYLQTPKQHLLPSTRMADTRRPPEPLSPFHPRWPGPAQPPLTTKAPAQTPPLQAQLSRPTAPLPPIRCPATP
jgi:hypothetical protein